MHKKIVIFGILALFSLPLFVKAAHFAGERAGYILLQVEKNGEAWYVYPANGSRYYLGRPADAFEIMKKLALGATHAFIENTTIFPTRLAGMILLDVEQNGEAYYIYPKDRMKYYLGRPADAFRIMRELGQGIADSGLVDIPVAELIGNVIPTPTTGQILQSVPFTSQAPFGDWADQRQEDGCEEASSLMAIKWARSQSLTLAESLNEITGISDFLLQKYGEYRDISLNDTLDWIIKDYFAYQNAAIKPDATVDDLIAELQKGNIIIAPMNGQILHNPFYTQPGPIHHMLVIRGYNPATKRFITNDPGTRRGESYEYGAQDFYEAIRDYPTGFHELLDTIKKDVIVVWK